MTPDQIQTELNRLQAELDKLKQLPDGMIGNSSDSSYIEKTDHYIPQPGEVVLIDDKGDDFKPRIFVKYNKRSNEPFECVCNMDEDEYRCGESYETNTWKLCRRLSGEIIEFGCDAMEASLKAIDDYYDKHESLLPTGYEFCTEEEAEKWVKVEFNDKLGIQSGLGFLWEYGTPRNEWKPYYRPIRPIQYHVAVHEATTIEPNPYAVDWANAPEWADVHCFDKDGKGFWHGVEIHTTEWCNFRSSLSPFTLPAGLDWKLSKTVRPK